MYIALDNGSVSVRYASITRADCAAAYSLSFQQKQQKATGNNIKILAKRDTQRKKIIGEPGKRNFHIYMSRMYNFMNLGFRMNQVWMQLPLPVFVLALQILPLNSILLLPVRMHRIFSISISPAMEIKEKIFNTCRKS